MRLNWRVMQMDKEQLKRTLKKAQDLIKKNPIDFYEVSECRDDKMVEIKIRIDLK